MKNFSLTFKKTILFLISGLVISIGLIGGCLYGVSKFAEGLEVSSTGGLLLFSLSVLIGIFLCIVIDGLFSVINGTGHNKFFKTCLMFISKTTEVLCLVEILHQVDYWIKGIECSDMAEVWIGYCAFLFMEMVFSLGNRLLKKPLREDQDKK